MSGNHEAVGVSEAIRLSLGAYILGTLSVEEDEQVRAHLEQCAECRAEHARLAGLPALLATISEAEAAGEAPPAPSEDLVDRLVQRAADRPQPAPQPRERPMPATAPAMPEAAEEGGLDKLLRQAAATRRRTTWRRQLVGAAAGLVLVGAAAGGTWWATSGSGGTQATPPGSTASAPARTFQASDPATGVSATVKASPAAWGSALQISVKGVPAGVTCTLQVTGLEGAKAVGASWLAGEYSGDSTQIPGAVSIPPGAIGQFKIVNGSGNTLLTIPA